VLPETLPSEPTQGGHGGKEYRPLASRSLVWLKLRHRAQPRGPFVYLLNTQLTGGCYVEDRHFAGQLARERRGQTERILQNFQELAGKKDVGILVGDFGTAPEDAPGTSDFDEIAGSNQVYADAEGVSFEELKERYEIYLWSPFTVLREHGWHLAYGHAQLACSQPGGDLNPIVHHMATNRFLRSTPQVFPVPGTRASPPDSSMSLACNVVKNSFSIAFTVDQATEATRRARLRREHADLVREHSAEQQEAEEVQARLAVEMRELRDYSHEQGQTIGTLTRGLQDAHEAFTLELQRAAAMRSHLGGELMSEESQRRALETAHNTEQAEVEGRMRMAEHQLETMSTVHSSLVMQLRTSRQIQDELRAHIEDERRGRSELEAAGRRELEDRRRREDRVHAEMEDRLAEERDEAETWKMANDQEMSVLQQEYNSQCREEAALAEQLRSMQDAHSRRRDKLHSEAAAWQQEVEELRRRERDLDERCEWEAVATEQIYEELSQENEEHTELKKEFAEKEKLYNRGNQNAAQVREEQAEARASLQAAQEKLAAVQEDPVLSQLRAEHRQLCEQRNESAKRVAALRSELDASRSKGIFCWRRRLPPSARSLDSPECEPPLPPPDEAPSPGPIRVQIHGEPAEPAPPWQGPASVAPPPLSHSTSKIAQAGSFLRLDTGPVAGSSIPQEADEEEVARDEL